MTASLSLLLISDDSQGKSLFSEINEETRVESILPTDTWIVLSLYLSLFFEFTLILMVSTLVNSKEEKEGKGEAVIILLKVK
jgi:hypothetical protein